MNKKRNNKGFSLVELIVVIAVMAVLVVVLAPAYLRYVDKARLQKDVSAVSEVVQSIKIAASEEAVSKTIPTKGEEGATALRVTIDTTGAISVADEKPAAEGTEAVVKPLGKEIRATVGDKIEFSSKALSGKSVTIDVMKDSNYNLIIDVAGDDALNSLDENVKTQ